MTLPRSVGRSSQLVALLSFAALFAASLAFAPRARAQNSTMLSTGVSVDVCNSCDLQTQEAVASEDDRHDSADSAFDSSERAENVSHDEADQSIQRSNMPGEVKQEALANEQERHQNTLTAIERDRAIEASRHQQRLAQIMAQAGKLLSDLVQNVMPNGSPAGGTPSGGGAPTSPNQPGPGNAPSGGGNPSMPSGAGGGNPVAGGGGGSPNSGGNPSGTAPPPISANPIAGGGSPNPSGGGSQNPPNNTQYPGAQQVNPSQPSASPQNSSSNPGNQSPGILKGLNDWINGLAQKMAPPPSTGTGQPYTGPLAINGHSPLYYLNEAANSLADKLPGGSSGLQQANQAVGNVANGQRNQWTTPMSPQAAVGQVGYAFTGAVIGKGLGASAGVLKGAYGQAIQNGAGRMGALQTAGNSIAAATTAGIGAARQEATTLAGMGGAAAGNLGTNPGGGSYNGSVSSGGGSEPPGGAGGSVGGGPNEQGGGPAPGEASSSTSTQTAQASGQSRTQPAAGGGGSPPEESVPPADGAGTPSNPLTGAAVSNSWENLAGKTIVVGGQPVQLGNMVGSPGGFGAVYQMAEDPSKVIKIVRPGEIGADSITRQLEGAELANAAGVKTPAVYQASAGANGDPPHIIMDNVMGGKWSNVQMPSQAQLTPQQATALQQMYNQLGQNDLIWADGKLNNVFFYDSPESPSVGILDPDMIFPSSQLPWQPPVVGANLMKNASAAMKATLGRLQYTPEDINAVDVMRDRFKFQFPSM